MNEVVAILKEQLEDAIAERDAAIESERRIWRAYSMAKGAAERAVGCVAMIPSTSSDDALNDALNDSLDEVMRQVNDDLVKAEKLSGVET